MENLTYCYVITVQLLLGSDEITLLFDIIAVTSTVLVHENVLKHVYIHGLHLYRIVCT